jgi:predicted Zn-dependent protease
VTDTVEGAVGRAASLIDLGRHADAIPLLEQALATRPDDTRLLGLLARAQTEVDPAAGLATAERLVALAPDTHRGHLLASYAARRLKRTKEAEAHARAAVERAPGLPDVHALLSQTLVDRRRKLREAMREAQVCVDLAPDSAVGYVTAGNVELARGRRGKAETWYRRALDVDPSSRPAQINIAITDRAAGRLNRAFGNVDALLQFDATDERARRALDDTVYATLLHFQWLALGIAVLVAVLRLG